MFGPDYCYRRQYIAVVFTVLGGEKMAHYIKMPLT